MEMEHMSMGLLIFLVSAGFLAAFVDSVVGGGGLISVPALLLTGLPPSVVLGTNKLASTLASFTSTVAFIRSGKVDLQLVRWYFPLSLIGSAGGVVVVQLLPSSFLKPVVVVLLIVVAVYTLFKKNWGEHSTFRGLTQKTAVLCALAALGMGFYDGFFGPGAGSFLLFIFLMLGFDFVSAAGNAKVLNFGSNIAALVLFICFGLVNYQHGLIMGIAMIAGALVGSKLAIRKGAAYVKPLFICVTVLLVGKQIWDYMH